MPHIGDGLGDCNHGVGLLERPVDSFHHPVKVLGEPVVAHLELLDGHVLRPDDDGSTGEFCIVGADDRVCDHALYTGWFQKNSYTS